MNEYHGERVSDDDEEPLTAKMVLESLEKAWINEKFAPELLPHQMDLVDIMVEQIAHIEENVKKLNKNDFRAITHKMELERIRYVIASYLRCRLQKIEKFCSYIIDEESRNPDNLRLSENEMIFCRKYSESIEKHFYQLAIRHMPENIRDHGPKNRLIKPNLKSHVFFKANSTIEAVAITGHDEEEVNIRPGSQYIMPYNLVSNLILSGEAQLF